MACAQGEGDGGGGARRGERCVLWVEEREEEEHVITKVTEHMYILLREVSDIIVY